MLGDPGAGKTTLLRFLGLQFTQAYRDGKPAVSGKDDAEYGETRLPIFLHVADYAEAFANNKTLRLAEFLATPFKDIAPELAIASLFNDALKRGQAFVMLDGLDEVIDTSDRALIAGRIEDFVAGLDARNRVIVTSRIVGYREAPLGGDYQHFTLLDLERDQIEQFLRNWCHETERFLSKDASKGEISRNAEREIDSILHAVDNNPGVKRLAVNPLLLTILALIHRNGSRLPNRRVKLYDLAAETLLETWQIERMNAGKFNIREGEASQFLWPLAYWLHSEKPRGMATEQEIKYQLAKFLSATRKQEPDHPEIIAAADDFLRRVRHHTGLLVERAPNQYGFMHLTFEEYFAARELVRRPERVAKKIHALRHQPRWREPILLAIGYLSEAFPSMPGDIIRSAILAEGENAEEEGFKPSLYEDVLHRDLLFAAQCIGDCATIEPGLQRQVVERLVKLYLDPAGAGKYETLRSRIAEALNYLRNSEAASEAAEMALAALRDENEDVRCSAAEALGELKVGAPEVVRGLLVALRDENEDVRRSAASALGELKASAPEVVISLLAALRDEERQVRSLAAMTLDKIGGAPEAVSVLLAALRDEREYVRSSAVRVLGNVREGAPEVVRGLLAALRDEHEYVRSSAAIALGKIGGAPEVVSGLLAALRDEKEQVRASVASALGELKVGAPEVVSGLLAALRDEEWQVRSSAAWALGNVKVDMPEVVNVMLAALRDKHEYVRGPAARTLGKIGGAPEVVSGLLAALRDEHEYVRRSAVEALGEAKVGTPEVVSRLLAALRNEKNDVRGSAAWALGKIGGSPEVVSGLLAALRDENEDVRGLAAKTLSVVNVGTPEVVSGLLAALRDEHEFVRGSAAITLGEVTVGTPEVVSGLLAALRDEREYVRSSAAWALGGIGGSPEVVRGLLAALRDEKVDVRGLAAKTLGEVKVGTPEVVSGLLAALRDENEDVRRSAAWALGKVSKDRKSKLPKELIHQIADTLRGMLDDPRNQGCAVMFVSRLGFAKPADAIWEALLLICQRMDEQCG